MNCSQWQCCVLLLGFSCKQRTGVSSQAYAVTLGGYQAKRHGQCAQLIRSLCGDPVQQNMIWLLRNVLCESYLGRVGGPSLT